MTETPISSAAQWRGRFGWWMLTAALALFIAALFVFPVLLGQTPPEEERFTLLQSFMGGTAIAAIGLVFTAVKYWWTLMTRHWLPIVLTAFVLLALVFTAILYLA